MILWALLLMLVLPIGQVFAESQVITSQSLVEVATSVIQVRAGAMSNDITISPLYQPQEIQVPLGSVELAVELPNGIHYNAPTPVNVNINVNGRLVSKVGLRFDVKLYQNIVVAARSIGVGEILTSEALRYQRLDAGRLASGYSTDTSKVLGLVVHRQVNPGMILNEFMLYKPVLVKRGSIVTILARIGGIEVTTTGQALQDGSIDKVIRVKNLNSPRIIAAKVLDESTVLVSMYNST